MKRLLPIAAAVLLVSLVAGDSFAAASGAHEPRTYFGIPENILKFVNMVLFFGLLAYLIKGPVGRAFKERREGIRTRLAEAKTRREKAGNFAADMEKRLEQLEREVAAILERAQEEGDRQKRELIAAGEAEAAKILVTARNEVDARLKAARKELTDYAGELAADRARSILEQSLTDSDRRRLFAESVEQIGQVRG